MTVDMTPSIVKSAAFTPSACGVPGVPMHTAQAWAFATATGRDSAIRNLLFAINDIRIYR